MLIAHDDATSVGRDGRDGGEERHHGRDRHVAVKVGLVVVEQLGIERAPGAHDRKSASRAAVVFEGREAPARRRDDEEGLVEVGARAGDVVTTESMPPPKGTSTRSGSRATRRARRRRRR